MEEVQRQLHFWYKGINQHFLIAWKPWHEQMICSHLHVWWLFPRRWLELYVKNLITRAGQHTRNEEHHAAVRSYKLALAITRYLGLKQVEGQLFGNIGGVYLALANYEAARNCSLDALRLADEVDDSEGKITAMTNLGHLFLNGSSINRAIEQFQEAHTIARECSSLNQSVVLLGLGIAYQRRGQFDRAITYYFAAQALAIQQNNPEHVIFCSINLANIYSHLGNCPEAVWHSQHAVSLGQHHKHKRALSLALITLGNVLADWGDTSDNSINQQLRWKAAVVAFENACVFAVVHNDRTGQLLAQLNQATMFIRQERFIDALTLLKDHVSPLAYDLEDTRSIAYCAINRVDALIRLNSQHKHTFQESEHAYVCEVRLELEQALKRLETMGDDEGKRIVHERMGDLYACWFRDEQRAYQHYTQSINLWEQTRGRLAADDHRMGFLGRGLDPYHRLVTLCFQTHNWTEALQTVERARSRTFLDQLERANMHRHTSDETARQRVVESGKPLVWHAVRALLQALYV
jgi:tetratricopeptide (TPR) repeat protein